MPLLFALLAVFSSVLQISSASADSKIILNGAGATFPYPLYSSWMSAYNKLHPDVEINYQSIGSGGGIRQITERTVDFGASDTPMTDDLLKKAPEKIIHIPTTLGAVAVTYNVPELGAGLKLTPDALVGMFLGEIKNWNDPKIAAQNPGIKLPEQSITIVHRSDGSGTTAIFTDYLSKVAPRWRDKVGAGTSINWPAGLGGKGNEGVAGQIKMTPGSIGYVELAYAVQARLTSAALKNRDGRFVTASLDAITSAAEGMSASIPNDFRVSIVDAPGPKSYPIAAFTYLLVYEQSSNLVKGTALAKFLWWAVHDGQKYAPGLDYATLPAELVKRIETKLKTLRVGGQPLLSKTM